jgi:hypothetical protein
VNERYPFIRACMIEDGVVKNLSVGRIAHAPIDCAACFPTNSTAVRTIPATS